MHLFAFWLLFQHPTDNACQWYQPVAQGVFPIAILKNMLICFLALPWYLGLAYLSSEKFLNISRGVLSSCIPKVCHLIWSCVCCLILYEWSFINYSFKNLYVNQLAFSFLSSVLNLPKFRLTGEQGHQNWDIFPKLDYNLPNLDYLVFREKLQTINCTTQTICQQARMAFFFLPKPKHR